MNINIRKIKNNEYKLLENFLYEAIFIPQGIKPPTRDIINSPELQVYIENFGTKKDDICFVAEVDNKVVGAVWVRIMNDYGHIEDDVPSLAISIYKKYRGYGIGTMLMRQMLNELKNSGYMKVSLSVQKENYALNLYKKVGFEIVNENIEEYIMIYNLQLNKQRV